MSIGVPFPVGRGSFPTVGGEGAICKSVRRFAEASTPRTRCARPGLYYSRPTGSKGQRLLSPEGDRTKATGDRRESGGSATPVLDPVSTSDPLPAAPPPTSHHS